MNITKHASKRSQQRGISRKLIELIMMHGEPIAKPGGVTEYRLTSKAKTTAQSEIRKQLMLIEKACNKGVLVDEADNTLISVYHIM